VAEPVVFDKAAWHLEGDWPKNLDSKQAYVHTGFFVGWLAERRLLSDEIAAEPAVADFKKRITTAPELYRRLGGVLASDMMSPEGTQFATDYHVPDSRENYETMRAILDGRFASWRKQRT